MFLDQPLKDALRTPIRTQCRGRASKHAIEYPKNKPANQPSKKQKWLNWVNLRSACFGVVLFPQKKIMRLTASNPATWNVPPEERTWHNTNTCYYLRAVLNSPSRLILLWDLHKHECALVQFSVQRLCSGSVAPLVLCLAGRECRGQEDGLRHILTWWLGEASDEQHKQTASFALRTESLTWHKGESNVAGGGSKLCMLEAYPYICFLICLLTQCSRYIYFQCWLSK